MITNIHAAVARNHANANAFVDRRHGMSMNRGRAKNMGMGVGDVNDDAETLLAQQGITADCMYVPYLGPMGGGTNVCDIEGDVAGYAYGAELLARLGGVDILQAELNSGYNSLEVLMAENARIVAAQNATAAGGGIQTATPTTYTGTQTGIVRIPAPQPMEHAPVVTQTATIQNPVTPAGSNPIAVQTNSVTGFLSTIPGLEGIPTWALIAGGIAALLSFFKTVAQETLSPSSEPIPIPRHEAEVPPEVEPAIEPRHLAPDDI